MDLGISGRTAIVCGAATDLGNACVLALVNEGVQVVAADAKPLETQAEWRTVQCDVRNDADRSFLIDACPQPDILVNHAAGPPMGDFREWRQDDWHEAINTNMLTAIDMIRQVLDGMTERGFGRIINITSQSVRAPMPNLDLSNASRAGLTGFVAGVARERRDADVTINNILPGLFDTAPLQNHINTLAESGAKSEAELLAGFTDNVPLGRLGTLDEFGAICAFLCGRPAGYINGQNILIDGGAFPGVI